MSGDEIVVSAYSGKLGQVVSNLISNSLRHTPEGGHISVDIAAAGNSVRITVEDDGEGIPAEHLPHIFERFYKADKAHTAGKGTGLGLSICRRILEAHGQTIRLLPTEKGAAFEFTLEKGKEKGGREKPAQEEEA